MKYGNCWIYALKLWFKNPRKTYLVVRISKHSWVPHVFFAPTIDKLYVEEFKPVVNVKKWYYRWFPIGTLVFRGRERKGIGEEHKGPET